MPRPSLTGPGAVAGLALGALLRQRAIMLRRQSAADALLREHTALREVAALVARGVELEPLCSTVAQSAADLLGCEAGLVLRFEGDRGILVGRWVRSLRDYPEPGQEMPSRAGGAVEQVRRTGRTVRVPAGAPSPFRDDLGERVASPITLDGRLWGAVAVAGTRAAPLPAHADERLESFAELVALAIGNAEARAQLVAQAMTDPLTGVANRRAFAQRIGVEFARASRHQRDLSLVVFDVDRFKSINDSGGHLQGDAVLVEISRRLQSALRCDSLLGRLGGDEFAAVLPECDQAAARTVADRAMRAVSAQGIGSLARVTVSAGVAERLPSDRSGEDLYQRADADLYRAKHPAVQLGLWRGSSAA